MTLGVLNYVFTIIGLIHKSMISSQCTYVATAVMLCSLALYVRRHLLCSVHAYNC